MGGGSTVLCQGDSFSADLHPDRGLSPDRWKQGLEAGVGEKQGLEVLNDPEELVLVQVAWPFRI